MSPDHVSGLAIWQMTLSPDRVSDFAIWQVDQWFLRQILAYSPSTT